MFQIRKKLFIRWFQSQKENYQRISDLGQVDKFLIGRRAHVEAYGEHLFQGSHDKWRLHRVTISPFLLLCTFGIRASTLGKDTVKQREFTVSHNLLDVRRRSSHCSVTNVRRPQRSLSWLRALIGNCSVICGQEWLRHHKKMTWFFSVCFSISQQNRLVSTVTSL